MAPACRYGEPEWGDPRLRSNGRNRSPSCSFGGCEIAEWIKAIQSSLARMGRQEDRFPIPCLAGGKTPRWRLWFP